MTDDRRDGRIRPPRSAIRGLDERAASRPALALLSEIPWDGPELEPDTTLAGVFLANL
jgi:hypothetical protein